MRQRLATTLLTLAGLAGVALGVAPAAHAQSTSSFAAQLVSLINSARSQNGLPTLTVASGTTTVAQGWTYHLAQSGSLSHNPDLGPQLESHGSRDWSAYGENVGATSSSATAKTLFDAYMNSPEHRANILKGAYRYVGVGVVASGSAIWNTLDFVDEYSSGSTHTTSSTAVGSTSTSARPVHRVTQADPLTAPVFHRIPAVTRVAAPRTPARRIQAHAPLSRLVRVDATSSARPVAAPAGVPMQASATTPVPTPHRSGLPIVVAFVVLLLAGGRFVLSLVRRAA